MVHARIVDHGRDVGVLVISDEGEPDLSGVTDEHAIDVLTIFFEELRPMPPEEGDRIGGVMKSYPVGSRGWCNWVLKWELPRRNSLMRAVIED